MANLCQTGKVFKEDENCAVADNSHDEGDLHASAELEILSSRQRIQPKDLK